MNMTSLANIINSLLALIIALTFHEFAHALAARWQGDRTAQSAGRLTLNPVPHIDPVGTLLFPLIGSMAGGILFGWAKPVPVDTRQLKNPKWGFVMVAAAGPAANLVLCVVFIFLFRILEMFGPVGAPYDTLIYPLIQLCKPMIAINAFLAIFNLLPLYPLDGGTIFMAFLPDKWREWYDAYITPYAMFILLALFFTNSLSWMGAVAMGYIRISDFFISGLFS